VRLGVIASLLPWLCAAANATAQPPPETTLSRLKAETAAKRAGAVIDPLALGQLSAAALKRLKQGPRMLDSDHALSTTEAVALINSMGIRAYRRSDGNAVIAHPKDIDDHGEARVRTPWMAIARARELLGAEPLSRDEAAQRIDAIGGVAWEGGAAQIGTRFGEPFVHLYPQMGKDDWAPIGDFLALARRWRWEDVQLAKLEHQAVLRKLNNLGFDAELRFGSLHTDHDGAIQMRDRDQGPQGVYVFFDGLRSDRHRAVPIADALSFADAWARLHRPPMPEEYGRSIAVPASVRRAMQAARKLGFVVHLAEGYANTDALKKDVRVVVESDGQIAGGGWFFNKTVPVEDLRATVEFWAKWHRPPTDEELAVAKAQPAKAVGLAAGVAVESTGGPR
jgi:hypothetical protein